jgi:hypothetical protein
MSQITTSSTSTNSQLGDVVSAIFAKMLLDYGKKFTDQWGAADATALSAHWVSGLTGYTPREIKRGLAAMEDMDWPPTLPAFKKMCRPPISDMAAYYEAIAGLEARDKGEVGVWSHPAVFWAASLLRVDLMGQTHAQVKDRWSALLKAQMERTEWAEIPAPRVLLPAPDLSPEAKAHATKMLADLDAAGIAKSAFDKIDHKRWARKILERVERGDKTLEIVQIKDAKMAMGVMDEVVV